MPRIVRLALVAALATLIVLALLGRTPLQWIGLMRDGPSAEQIKSGNNILPDLRQAKLGAVDPHAWRGGSNDGFKEPKVDAKSPYPFGKTKPAGSNYTRCLVMPKISSEATDWVDEDLGDMVESGLLTKAIYVMDDPSAPLHPVKNKGNEVMAYLSYIIDYYDKLPDVAIFMHSHRFAWHNNLILNEDASLMVRHLSSERVTREGYMNLRCHWDPGCPDWLHPADKEKVPGKEEQQIFAASWAELFPRVEIPTALGQPCCGQFAVSRERILAIPKEHFVWLRDWAMSTILSDFLAGRVFEYIWQYIFTASAFHCPSMSACYCDGYGLCFGDPVKFDYYFELNFNLKQYKDELQRWNEKAQAVTLADEEAKGGNGNGKEEVESPEAGRDKWLEAEIEKIEYEMKRRREAAVELGKDPRQRAKEAGRLWQEGDGF